MDQDKYKNLIRFRTKRYPDSITLWVDENTKAKYINLSREKGIRVAEYLRDAINKEMDKLLQLDAHPLE